MEEDSNLGSTLLALHKHFPAKILGKLLQKPIWPKIPKIAFQSDHKRTYIHLSEEIDNYFLSLF
jgi:hypothetical protein